MSIATPEISIRLRILKRPPRLTCRDEYVVGSYGVCITEREYVPYDLATSVEGFEKEVVEIEEKLLRLLLSEEYRPEDMIKKVPEQYQPVVKRQFFSYGVLEPLFIDDNIIDIHITYKQDLGSIIQVIHRRYGRLDAHLDLTLDELREIVLRMGSSAGKVISESRPLHSFIEPNYDTRVSIVYFSDVTMRRGMSVDIRKQPKKPWTALKLLDMGTISLDELAFLWFSMKYKVPILVIGELMSGKTTLINAILNLVPPDSRVLTIEDAPELKVYVKSWHRTTTREADINPIQIFDILKVAMRITADYIVIGEIRGQEAREWAQGILLGHGGISSFHAQDPESALVRLRTPPIEVDEHALRMINIMVKMIPVRSAGQGLTRRAEVYVFDEGKLNKAFKYDPEKDAIESVIDEKTLFNFRFMERVMIAHGLTRAQMLEEYRLMKMAISNLYRKYKALNPGLEQPDYETLPRLLYNRVELYKMGISEEEVQRAIAELRAGKIVGEKVSEALNTVMSKKGRKVRRRRRRFLW